MTLLLIAASAIGLILFVAFVAARLIRARTAGFSVRMQVFLALASVIGAFAFGVGLLTLDRIEARATLLGSSSARDEAGAMAALVGGEIEARSTSLEEVAAQLQASRVRLGAASIYREARGLALLDREGKPVFSTGPSPDEPSTVAETAPIVVRGEVVGSVRVVNPTLVIRRVLADFAPTILTISVMLGVVAAIAADVIGRAIAKPIESLTDFAVRVSEGERRAAPPPAYGREVASLSLALDSMRRQLEGRPFVETFAADLSHELKNPVAAIRASAEVLADGALDEPEEAMRFVTRIREATTRIESLLGDLLSLARIEARGVEAASAIDVGELLESAAARARERGVEVSIEKSGGAGVRGDRLWLARAIENLIDNAEAHGEKAPIEATLARDGDSIALSVKNRGEVNAHVAKRLFGRFVTTRSDRGGTGLGLAIVRAIAEAHRGSVECIRRGPPVVEFRLKLPSV